VDEITAAYRLLVHFGEGFGQGLRSKASYLYTTGGASFEIESRAVLRSKRLEDSDKEAF
jgi:hypothetical protein